MQSLTLNNGVQMPIVGFGVYQIPKADTQRCVEEALALGYRLIDTAAAYFNEAEVGAAIKASGLKREEIFVTGKLWVQDYESEDAKRACALTCHNLGLDYLDLYLLHKPYGNYYAAWRALEDLQAQGVLRAIGVTSFSSERLQDLMLHNKVVPAVNQLETHPFYTQEAAHAFLQAHGIVHQAWSPFAEGLNNIFSHPLLQEIAAAHGKGVGAVILRYLIQREIGVIPKSVHHERMKENLQIFDFSLNEDEMARIGGLNTGASPIYDDQDLNITKFIGTMKIHD